MSKNEKNTYQIYGDKEILTSNKKQLSDMLLQLNNVNEKILSNIGEIVEFQIYNIVKKSGVDVNFVNIDTTHEYNDEGICYCSSVCFDDENYETGIYGSSDDYDNSDPKDNLRKEIDNFIGKFSIKLPENLIVDMKKLSAMIEKYKLNEILPDSGENTNINKI